MDQPFLIEKSNASKAPHLHDIKLNASAMKTVKFLGNSELGFSGGVKGRRCSISLGYVYFSGCSLCPQASRSAALLQLQGSVEVELVAEC